MEGKWGKDEGESGGKKRVKAEKKLTKHNLEFKIF